MAYQPIRNGGRIQNVAIRLVDNTPCIFLDDVNDFFQYVTTFTFDDNNHVPFVLDDKCQTRLKPLRIYAYPDQILNGYEPNSTWVLNIKENFIHFCFCDLQQILRASFWFICLIILYLFMNLLI